MNDFLLVLAIELLTQTYHLFT